MFVPMAAVDELSGTITDAEDRRLIDVRDKSYRTFTSGDVLFAKITPCMENGKAAVAPDIPSALGFGSTEFHVLRPIPSMHPRYLWHFVRQDAFRKEAERHMTGSVGQARVPKDFLEQSCIPVPSVEQQQAIVEVLDTAIAKARSATDRLATAKLAIERFRQAVLAAACAGRLTEEWRDQNRSAEPAKMLVARIGETKQKQLGRRYRPQSAPDGAFELPDGWCWTSLGALVDVATGATPLRRRSDYYGGTIPWVTSGAVNAGVITAASEHITEAALRETNAKVFPAGTLLVAMYGEGQTRGRVAELGINAATNQAVAALLFDEETECIRPYLKLFLLENYERIRLLSFGGVQPNLSLGAVRDTVVPLPPLDEQPEIVQRVNHLLAVAGGLLERIRGATVRVEQSSQAVLAKAFRGELTNGIIDAASG